MSDEAGEKILEGNAGVYIPSGSSAKVEVSIDFGGFIVGLYQSALMSMGRLPHPDGVEVELDLEAAKHTIDIVKMLEQKTRGNLEPEEARLIAGLLHELRVAYVEVGAK